MVTDVVRAIPERHKATLGLVTATSLFGMYGVFARYLGNDFDAFTQFFSRNLLVAFILAIVVALFQYRPWRVLQKKDAPWIFGWALSRSAAAAMFFFSVLALPIGMTVMLYYAGSLVSAYLLGALIFGEKVTLRKMIAVALSIVGLVVIGYGDLTVTNGTSILLAAGAGLIGSLWNIFSKKFSGEYPASQLAMIDAVLSALFMLPLMLFFGSTAPAISLSLPWLIILAYALSQFLTVRLIVFGFRNLEAQTASLIMPVELFFASLYGFILFGEVLTVPTIVGGALIAFASVATTLPVPLPRRTNVGLPLYQRAYAFVRAAKPRAGEEKPPIIQEKEWKKAHPEETNK